MRNWILIRNIAVITLFCLAGGVFSPFMDTERPTVEKDMASAPEIGDIASMSELDTTPALIDSYETEDLSESLDIPLSLPPAAPRTPTLQTYVYTLQKGYYTSWIPTSAGQWKYFKLAMPFNSALYRAVAYEYSGDASTLNIDMYIKFNALPTPTDYDYRRATSGYYEYFKKDVPEDDEYGTMYILVRCTWGAGHFKVRGWYQADANGAWRSADQKASPSSPLQYGVQTHIGGSLSSYDLNDFYKVYLYSGQTLYISTTATPTYETTYGARVYVYGPSHNYLKYDYGYVLSTWYTVTSFSDGWYYIRFYNPDYNTYSYSGYITDYYNDPNNRHTSPTTLVDGTTYGGMGYSDINDYAMFEADSGEKITLSITFSNYVSYPGYYFFLYTTTPDGYNYLTYKRAGYTTSTVTIEYYCGEYRTSDIQPGTQNKIYLRVWNTARYYGKSDVYGNYAITLARSWPANNDRMTTAPPYTNWGNSTTPKIGDLSGAADNNDWFRIPATQNYTIDIAVNSSSTPNPFLDGYLVDSTGDIVKSDSYYNITIKYTARYTGDYYFRLYERPAAYSSGSYSGSSPYSWYIYTSKFDGNDNFTAAEEITPPESIYGLVTDSHDLDDYYKVEVPSGYEVRASLGGNGLALSYLKLYLYDASQTEVDATTSVPQVLTHQNKGLDTETYYIRIQLVTPDKQADYTLTVQLLKKGTDDNMADATSINIGIGESAANSDSMDTTDINDYYSFIAMSGDKLLVNVTGTNGYIVRLVMNDSNTEVLLAEETITGGIAAFEYFPHTFYPETTYYLRICNPGGAASGAYSWNITRVEYDTEDGYYIYGTRLEPGQSTTINGALSTTDANDWYLIPVRSGEEIEVELTSTLSDPHAGFELVAFLYREIFDSGSTVSATINNTLPVQLPFWIQVVNEAGGDGTYTLDITVSAIDSDNNGLPENAASLPLNTNTSSELSFTDLNDMYAVEIRSGYNLTVHFELDSLDNFTGQAMGCLLLDENLAPIDYLYANETGAVTYTNPNLEPIQAYVQFYNLAPWLGLNSTESYGKFTWNATLVNDDPDGDFNNATTLSGPTATKSDSLFVNITSPTYNLSDLNDFYKVSLAQGGVLSVSITISGAADPWFGVYIYNGSEVMVANVTGSSDLTLLFNAGDEAGEYYIRIYDTALTDGTYLMAVSISTDDDSYFGGATAISAGNQTANSLGISDVLDISSIQLGAGWRLKVNATVTGTTPDVDLIILDADRAAFAGNFTGTDYIEVEVTANSSGTYYIEFYNTGATDVTYNWVVYVYEDENGIFTTSTSIGSGEHDDNVQELDKYDYFAITGTSGEAVIIASSLPAGLSLEVYIFNSSKHLIDSDTTAPGLALTHTAASTGILYVLFTNPNGDTGEYTFTVTGAGDPPEVPGTSEPPGPGETSATSEEDNPITLLDEEVGDYKVWQWGAGGFVALLGLFFIKRKLFGGGK